MTQNKKIAENAATTAAKQENLAEQLKKQEKKPGNQAAGHRK